MTSHAGEVKITCAVYRPIQMIIAVIVNKLLSYTYVRYIHR